MSYPLGNTECYMNDACKSYRGTTSEGTTYRFRTFCDDKEHHEMPWDLQCRFGHGSHTVLGTSIQYGQQFPQHCSSYHDKCLILGHALNSDGSEATVKSRNCPSGQCYTSAHDVTSFFLYRKNGDSIHACQVTGASLQNGKYVCDSNPEFVVTAESTRDDSFHVPHHN